jgi:hypothetical protein
MRWRTEDDKRQVEKAIYKLKEKKKKITGAEQ